MIIGNINDKTQNEFLRKNIGIKTALDYVASGNFIREEGIREPIGEGCVAFINKLETREFRNIYETHIKNLDLFFVVKGVEQVCVTNKANTTQHEEYCEERDIMFMEGPAGGIVTLNEGDYLILFPEDAHAAALGDGSYLEKIIVKIPLELL